jgi:large subunit ribosomal protein L1|uniref:Ribosomal protein n=1 Tax=Thorea hispida TaxID=202687 RepID=A0A1C9CAL9_9FLOR|nr:ribosomal protein L1 [Thorea hispida]AOM65440.1 ribosomal protein L1 [Thorea hispida]UNJ79099.1 ribosomal protein L1 [Thorea hispida]
MSRKKSSSRFRNAVIQIEDRQYDYLEAITLLKNLPSAKFIETVEAHIVLGIDPKYADQQLRSNVVLPKGTGKNIKIAVIARGEKAVQALEAGADIAEVDGIINQIENQSYDFDKLIATPDVMPLLAKLGRILGPKGLMPSPKAGTVTWDVLSAVKEFKGGKLEYKVDKAGILHIPFGKINFSVDDLAQNLCSVQESIDRNRPSGAKGKYWKKLYICSTMGPSISINMSSLFNR